MTHLKFFIESYGQVTRPGHLDPDSHRAIWDTTPATLSESSRSSLQLACHHAPLVLTPFYFWPCSFVLLITLLDFMFTAYFCNIAS